MIKEYLVPVGLSKDGSMLLTPILNEILLKYIALNLNQVKSKQKIKETMLYFFIHRFVASAF